MTTSEPASTANPSESNGLVLDRYSRTFLLLLSGVNLVLGLIFYIYPPFVIPYWPWPVKELAVRFFGAIFLAIAFGCWSAVHAERWQRAKVLVLVGGTFFGITGIVSLVRGITVSNDASSWVWTGYFLIAASGCLVLLQRYGWHRRQGDSLASSTIPRGARVFFGIQTSVVGIFGIMMLLLPSIAQQEFWPWKVYVSTLQTFAALFLATCLATGWAAMQKDPERIRVLLPLDAIFPSLALLAVGISWRVIVAESPSWLVTGVWVGLYSFVAAGSTILYFALRRHRN
jgi:hypothetical protein